jgi:hypothetical protein
MERKTYLVEELFSDIPDDPDHIMLTFPPEFVESTGWKEGDTLNVEVIDGKLHITRVENK